ncbi:ellis-van Creveld syndrome isoform X1 [Pelobates cultripes]|uniref:Ellis-van Creveld syndrome isoform X1 n=1 Tax=Pelobates cultripes TaxID=61616 RepID=A0AAD1WCQ2_PELCU|nr:ellis-van Creveld syndrome isoform X1 [Pelobates cultripes]
MASSASLCNSDIVLQYSVESVQIVPGLLATAVVLGTVIGIISAGLLCVYVFLPWLSKRKKVMITGQGHKERTSEISEPDCEVPSKSKKKIVPRSKPKSLAEADNPLSDNGVAEFALKAKVIYPINQKFRPLADGASNPSLHENVKQTQLPNQMIEGSACSSIESLSHREKDDSSSSTTIHSTTSEDRFYERTFPRVTSFPEVLSCNSCDVKLCLYSLCLQSLPLLDLELRQEQHTMFVQILRINLTDLLLKKKIDGEMYRNILRTQEAELKELEERYRSRVTSTKLVRGQNPKVQTMEDIERKEREYSDHLIQIIESFWKQIENVHQFFMDQAKCTYDEAGRIMTNLISKMLIVDKILCESQEIQAMELQEKMISWEYMAKVVESLKFQIQKESECRLNAVSKTLEHLTAKKRISMRQKEKLFTELSEAFLEEVTQFNNDSLMQTKSLVTKQLELRRKLLDILQKSQKEERQTFLTKAQESREPDSFIKEYHKLLEKQRELLCDLEDEEDSKTVDSVVDLCKDLYTGASQKFEKLVKALFLQTLPEMTNMNLRECESLKQELKNNLSGELEKAENERKTRIKLFQEILMQEKQLWAREHVFSSTLHSYVSEMQQKIIEGVLSRLSGLTDESNKNALQRHNFLIKCVLRPLSLRNIAMATLTQMRMSWKISLLYELKEKNILEKSIWPCQDEEQWQIQNNMETRILEEERKLEKEMMEARIDFQQQLLADLMEVNLIIRQHMERTIGQALIQCAQQEAAKSMADSNAEFKERLVEAAVESVYVTSSGVSKLVQNYNQNLQRILQDHEEAKLKQMKTAHENTEITMRKSKQVLPASTQNENILGQANSDLHKRLFLQKKQLLQKVDRYQQTRLDSLRQKKSVLHRLQEELENRLKGAEEEFIAEVGALARIRLADGNNAVNKSLPESTIKGVSKKIK